MGDSGNFRVDCDKGLELKDERIQNPTSSEFPGAPASMNELNHGCCFTQSEEVRLSETRRQAKGHSYPGLLFDKKVLIASTGLHHLVHAPHISDRFCKAGNRIIAVFFVFESDTTLVADLFERPHHSGNVNHAPADFN